MEALLLFNGALVFATAAAYFKTGKEEFIPLTLLQSTMLLIGSVFYIFQ